MTSHGVRSLAGAGRACATALAWGMLLPLPWTDAAVRGLALAGAALSLLLLGAARPEPRSALPAAAFAASLLAFAAVNAVAALGLEPLPGIGAPEDGAFYTTGVALALCAGLGLRSRGALRLALAGLLIVSGGFYLRELVSLLWRDLYLDGRFAGHRSYHTLAGSELLILLALQLGWLLAARRAWERWLTGAAAAVLGVLLALNNTRSALLVLGAVVVPAALLVGRPPGGARWRALSGSAWLCAGFPLAALAWWWLSDPSRHSLANAGARFEAWSIALEIAAAAPLPALLFGHGAWRRVFASAAMHYGTDAPVTRAGETFVHAHNALLQVLVEAGVAGVLLLVAIYALALARAAAALRAGGGPRPEAAALWLALLAIGALLQLDFFLHRLVGFFSWLLLGMAFALGWGESGARRRPEP